MRCISLAGVTHTSRTGSKTAPLLRRSITCVEPSSRVSSAARSPFLSPFQSPPTTCERDQLRAAAGMSVIPLKICRPSPPLQFHDRVEPFAFP
jgi:hypothetical protein